MFVRFLLRVPAKFLPSLRSQISTYSHPHWTKNVTASHFVTLILQLVNFLGRKWRPRHKNIFFLTRDTFCHILPRKRHFLGPAGTKLNFNLFEQSQPNILTIRLGLKGWDPIHCHTFKSETARTGRNLAKTDPNTEYVGFGCLDG